VDIKAIDDAVDNTMEEDMVEDDVDKVEGATRISTTQQRCQSHSSATTLPKEKKIVQSLGSISR
jgi:hypothetical protein